MQGGLRPLTGAARLIGIQDRRHGLAITPAGQGGDVLGAPIDQRQEKWVKRRPKQLMSPAQRRIRQTTVVEGCAALKVTCLNPQAL